jgi:hypothetical protein
MEYAVLHVYAQSFQHDVATIKGDRKALTKLRDAINEALSVGEGKADVFCNDGEGYEIGVFLEEDKLEKMELPYTDDL